jgi:hypothetical protein
MVLKNVSSFVIIYYMAEQYLKGCFWSICYKEELKVNNLLKFPAKTVSVEISCSVS